MCRKRGVRKIYANKEERKGEEIEIPQEMIIQGEKSGV